MAAGLNRHKGNHMTLSAPSIEISESGLPAERKARRLPFLSFLLRYPVFLLAFGPPIFRPRSTFLGTDTSQAHFDIWSFVQVGWLFAIAIRAMIRLGFAEQFVIPKQIRSVLKYPFFLGLLFTVSVTYSSGRAVSAEFSVLYFLTFICAVEFLVDAHQNPPDWFQFIFKLRLILIVVLGLVLLCLLFEPELVVSNVEGAGIRLVGGEIGELSIIGPAVAIISGYCFLYSLEPSAQSALLFMVGVTATAVTESRGAGIGLFLTLVVLVFQWRTRNGRASYILVSGCIAFILLAGAFVGTIGPDQLWNKFNRGLGSENFLTASGRTIYWRDVIVYTVSHPQGMGYIAGIRRQHFGKYAANLHSDLTNIGGTDNSYMQTLSDAGWLSLGVYLVYVAKVFSFGRRFAKRNIRSMDADTRRIWHALRCALLLFLYCLIGQIESSNYVLPLRQEFYVQFVIIVLILGASSDLMFRERSRLSLRQHFSPAANPLAVHRARSDD